MTDEEYQAEQDEKEAAMHRFWGQRKNWIRFIGQGSGMSESAIRTWLAIAEGLEGAHILSLTKEGASTKLQDD